jgi:wobble nucleotide-excising tRNase
MLERTPLIQGIGFLHDAHGARQACRKATLIYADDGRGKSTLASILRSASKNYPAILNAYRTIDGTFPPKVILNFQSGHRFSRAARLQG